MFLSLKAKLSSSFFFFLATIEVVTGFQEQELPLVPQTSFKLHWSFSLSTVCHFSVSFLCCVCSYLWMYHVCYITKEILVCNKHTQWMFYHWVRVSFCANSNSNISPVIFSSSRTAVGWPLKKHRPSSWLKLLLPGCLKMPHQPSCAQMFLLIFVVMPGSIIRAAWFPHACGMATTLELNELRVAADANGWWQACGCTWWEQVRVPGASRVFDGWSHHWLSGPFHWDVPGGQTGSHLCLAFGGRLLADSQERAHKQPSAIWSERCGLPPVPLSRCRIKG